MNARWTLLALLFSVAVNIAVVGTLVYFWRTNEHQSDQAFHGKTPLNREIMLHGAPHVPANVKGKIDSLRRDYHEQLVLIRASIDAEREAIIAHLMSNQVDRDSLEMNIAALTAKQIAAERLTIDHLLTIKPLLPPEDWRFFIQDLRPHRIATKIIKIKKGDSTSILYEEEEMTEKILEIETNDKTQTIELKEKQ
ncbi:periplasmic heavy metal sensor [candidate division KSB1 bacterium]|nr:periplasmic heavy metal sensor [candidate division KSB1 bacterium]